MFSNLTEVLPKFPPSPIIKSTSTCSLVWFFLSACAHHPYVSRNFKDVPQSFYQGHYRTQRGAALPVMTLSRIQSAQASPKEENCYWFRSNSTLR